MRWVLQIRPGGRRGGKVEVLILDERGQVRLTDTGTLASIEGRQETAARLAPAISAKLNVQASAEYVEAKLEEAWLAFRAETLSEEASGDQGPAAPGSAELLAAMPAWAREEGGAMLADPRLMERVADDVALLGVAGERELGQALYLIGTSRLLPHPAAARIFGPTASGKSYVLEKTARLFPPESVVAATTMTPQALYHMQAGSLVHRFVVAGERSRGPADEVAETTKALREMISSGRLSKLMPVKVRGEIVTARIEQEGPIAFVESTSLTQIFDEDENRCLPLATDETPGQTRRIIDKLAGQYARPVPREDVQRAVARHHALQRSLAVGPVVVPFAERLGELFAGERVEARRAFPMVLRVIEASALLHQVQRQRDGDGRLMATKADYALMRGLLAGPVARLLGTGLTQAARRFLGRLRGWAQGGNFTSTEARRQEKHSRGAVHGWIAELHAAGVVELVERGRGAAPHVWRLTGLDVEDVSVLPTSEQVFGPV
jgi:hypothetical protein